MPIHPTALVDRRATIDPTADIGPYVVIDGEVEVGPRTRVGPHVVLLGRTVIGADNAIHAGAVIGDEPQDLKYADAPAGVRQCRCPSRTCSRTYAPCNCASAPDGLASPRFDWREWPPRRPVRRSGRADTNAQPRVHPR